MLCQVGCAGGPHCFHSSSPTSPGSALEARSKMSLYTCPHSASLLRGSAVVLAGADLTRMPHPPPSTSRPPAGHRGQAHGIPSISPAEHVALRSRLEHQRPGEWGAAGAPRNHGSALESWPDGVWLAGHRRSGHGPPAGGSPAFPQVCLGLATPRWVQVLV